MATANVIINNVQYNDVPSILLPKVGGGTAEFTLGGGGGSSWELITEGDVTVNTTSTSAGSALSLTLGSAIYTSAKYIYVKIRDKVGRRSGYFYGSDVLFANPYPHDGMTTTLTAPARVIYRCDSNGRIVPYSGAYGVYGYDITSAGRLRIYRRYNSTYTLTINSTYHYKIYYLDTADGIEPFVDEDF